MGRPRSFDEGNVLDAAAEAFVRGGYEGTSVDDLVQALKLHRGSLYKAFGSKHGLFLAVLRHYVASGLPEAISRSGTSGQTDVAALSASGDLDLLLVAALERGPVDAQVAGLVRVALDDLEHAIGKATGAPPPAGPPRPVHALDLLGARLHERLHHGPDAPEPRPPTTEKDT
jgi:TetR/AcrR family transcriptional repressor of nem operon